MMTHDILVVLCTWHTPYVPLGLIYVSEVLLLVLSKFINIKTVLPQVDISYIIQSVYFLCAGMLQICG